MSFSLRIISPKGLIPDRFVDEVILPSSTGKLGILTGHIPLITTLDIGIIQIKIKDIWTSTLVLGGLAIVKPNDLLLLISGLEEINRQDLSKAKDILMKTKRNLDLAQTIKEKYNASQDLKIVYSKLEALKIKF